MLIALCTAYNCSRRESPPYHDHSSQPPPPRRPPPPVQPAQRTATVQFFKGKSLDLHTQALALTLVAYCFLHRLSHCAPALVFSWNDMCDTQGCLKSNIVCVFSFHAHVYVYLHICGFNDYMCASVTHTTPDLLTPLLLFPPRLSPPSQPARHRLFVPLLTTHRPPSFSRYVRAVLFLLVNVEMTSPTDRDLKRFDVHPSPRTISNVAADNTWPLERRETNPWGMHGRCN